MTTATVRTTPKRGRSGSRTRGLARRLFMLFALPIILVALWWFGSAGSTNYLNPPLSTIMAEFWPTWFGGRLLRRHAIRAGCAAECRTHAHRLRNRARLRDRTRGPHRHEPSLRAFLEPVLEFFRAIPPPVLVPVFMLFMGIGPEMRIAVITIGCLWPVLLNTVEGVRGLDPVLKDTTRAYRIHGWRRLFQFVLPGASPQIVTGARQSLSIGIILMVISEMFAGKDGLGFMIVQFQRSFAIPEMWGGVILLGLLGVVLSLIFRVITDAVLKWYYGYLQSQRGGS